jgi:predicted RecB family nuclease
MYKSSENLWNFNTRDLMRSAACNHCSELAIARELKISGVAALVLEHTKEVKGLPVTYGQAYEAALESELLESLGSEHFQRPEATDTFGDTVRLMKQGVPVIYQGALKHRIDDLEFSGRPDFLIREDYRLEFTEGKLTAKQVVYPQNEKYVAWDAKLASSAKADYLLQIALYTDALQALGLLSNLEPGLVLGSRELVSFEQIEIVPAMRLARDQLKNSIKNFSTETTLEDLVLFCDLKDSCRVCEYPTLCEKSRRDVDHLVQVAGINRTQIERLSRVGITTMAQLAAATSEDRPESVPPTTFDKIRSQARLQTNYRLTNEVSFEVLPDPEIAVLPPPSENDVFFDMEGFPYFREKGGLEYLFGSYLRNGKFVAFFAHDRNQEKVAFVDFMNFLMEKLSKDSAAHVYHYANYEVAALNRLSTRHSVMEREVAELIASGKMVDLYKVVKGSIMISQPSYSIKKLEAFYSFERKSKVLDAGSSIEEYDRYRQLVLVGDQEADKVLQQITDYNEDDCVSTLGLYQWLSTMPEAHTKYQAWVGSNDIKKAKEESRTSFGEDSPEARRAKKAEIELELLNRKTASMQLEVADWPWGKDLETDYRAKIWLALTHSMLYYNREDVIKWRDWAMRKDASYEQLSHDRKSLVVLGCEKKFNIAEFIGVAEGTKLKLSYRYRIEPGQTCFLKPDAKVFVRFNLGANQQDTDYGKILSMDGDYVEFERESTLENAAFEPNAIFSYEWIPLGNKPQVVAELVQSITKTWTSPVLWTNIESPVIDLLMRRKPRLATLESIPTANTENYLEAILAATKDLKNSVLAIQGPPGSGKTYLGSRTISELVATGKKIAVVANSHSAVENLLSACVDAGIPEESIAKRSQSGDCEDKPWETPSSNTSLANWRAKQSGGYVVGGTSWTFCAKEMLAEKFDYIFIDEAAQFSLVDAIAVSANARNMVLLGDPQQLTQVVQAVHPGGVDNSALGHYMGSWSILDSKFGYFVEVTRRMHEKVNDPVSWLSYQGKLKSHPDTRANVVEGIEPGLFMVPIEHEGSTSHSEEEAEKVLEIIREQVLLVGASEVLVVAPYNAQVDLIRRKLDLAGFSDVVCGTVDKFQGREAKVVIVSLAASTATDAPRGLDFLLDKNRLNVALSRAKANCYLVYSPNLTKSAFGNIEELKAVSRLIGLLSFAN